MTDDRASSEQVNPADALLREIRKAIAEIRFGSVEITIHDGAVVQIERKEKVRFPTPRRG